jgi:flagellar biosynthesis/type III secretory pathway protein FliH
LGTYRTIIAANRQQGHQKGFEKGLEEGIQQGLEKIREKGQVKGLINEFIEYGHISKRSLQQIAKHSLSLDLVQNVWDDYAAKEEIFGTKNVQDFIKLLKNGGILE